MGLHNSAEHRSFMVFPTTLDKQNLHTSSGPPGFCQGHWLPYGSWKSDGPKVGYTHNEAKSPESDTDGRQMSTLNCLSKHPIFEMVVRYS